MKAQAQLRLRGQYKYYTFLSVLYVTLMISAQAVAYRFIKIGVFLEPGGIFIFPATFAISDVIAEVYGPTLARRTIHFSLFSQAFYSLVPIFVNSLPAPSGWEYFRAYNVVFGSSWLVFVSNLIAVLVGMTLNAQIIGKTKLMTRGRFFSLRSLLSSALGECILTAIIVLIALLPVVGMQKASILFFNMMLFKLGFSFIAAFPANLLVVLFKKLDDVDVYEENISFNPLSRFIKSKSVGKSNVVKFESFGDPRQISSN